MKNSWFFSPSAIQNNRRTSCTVKRTHELSCTVKILGEKMPIREVEKGKLTEVPVLPVLVIVIASQNCRSKFRTEGS